MTIAIERRPCDTSAFAILDQPRLASADDASDCAGAATPLAASANWRERIDDIFRLYNLDDNWDGGGSPAPASALVLGAMKLALWLKKEKYPCPDRVGASVDGTIYFEWYTPAGYEEIEVTSLEDAEWRCVDNGADEAEIIAFNIR